MYKNKYNKKIDRVQKMKKKPWLRLSDDYQYSSEEEQEEEQEEKQEEQKKKIKNHLIQQKLLNGWLVRKTHT